MLYYSLIDYNNYMGRGSNNQIYQQTFSIDNPFQAVRSTARKLTQTDIERAQYYQSILGQKVVNFHPLTFETGAKVFFTTVRTKYGHNDPWEDLLTTRFKSDLNLQEAARQTNWDYVQAHGFNKANTVDAKLIPVKKNLITDQQLADYKKHPVVYITENNYDTSFIEMVFENGDRIEVHADGTIYRLEADTIEFYCRKLRRKTKKEILDDTAAITNKIEEFGDHRISKTVLDKVFLGNSPTTNYPLLAKRYYHLLKAIPAHDIILWAGNDTAQTAKLTETDLSNIRNYIQAKIQEDNPEIEFLNSLQTWFLKRRVFNPKQYNQPKI